MFPILNPPPSSLPCHPSGSSQCTRPKHPVSCIEPGLASHFIHDILHVSNHLFILNLSGERPFRYRSFLIEIPHLSSKVSFTVKLGQLVQESCKYQNDIARILLDWEGTWERGYERTCVKRNCADYTFHLLPPTSLDNSRKIKIPVRDFCQETLSNSAASANIHHWRQ